MLKWLLTLLLPCAVSAQQFSPLQVDSLFDALEQHQKLSGSIALAKAGEVIYQRSFGYARYQTGDTVLNSSETRYRVGSVSKVFTATLIMQLVEEGVLSLTQRLNAFFPEIPAADSITIEQLLRHRSGIGNLTDKPSYFSYMTDPMPRDSMIGIIAGFERDFAPNEQYAYSNSNYILLGYILEDLTGQSFAKILDERIARPLGLEDTYVGKTLADDPQVAYSYQRTGSPYMPQSETHMSVPGGAGAVVSTPLDLLRFTEALYNGELVSSPYLQMMQPVADEDYGLGLMWMKRNDSLKAIGHGGAIDGFITLLAIYSEPKQFNIAICTNGGSFRLPKVKDMVVQAFLGHAFAMPRLAAIQLTEQELTRYAGNYQSEDFPLDIRIYLEEGELKAQATGQPSIPLEARSPNHFVFDPADIQLFFEADGEGMRLEQYGQKVHFSRVGTE